MGGSLYASLSGDYAAEEQPGDFAAQPELSAAAAAQSLESNGDEGPSGDGVQESVAIFIGHAGSPDVVDFLKTVLDEFDIPYRVAESDFDGQRPVTTDVSKEMRRCGAAILVFARPSWARVSGGREVSSTQVMLYQLGAASVLYGDRVVSLTEEGLEESAHGAGYGTLQFERDRLADIALPLLAELRQIGVIDVRPQFRSVDLASDEE